MQTKAYFFDSALAFARPHHLPTGRDFVIRHLPFAEIYRSTAASHIYLGLEAAALLILTAAVGHITAISAYTLFFITGWFFTVSILFGAFWFNPFALEFRFVRNDCKEWARWMLSDLGSVSESWNTWYNTETATQYTGASFSTRMWRAIRISRLLFPAALLMSRFSPGHIFDDSTTFGLMILLALFVTIGLQIVHLLSMPCTKEPKLERAKIFACLQPFRRGLEVAVYAVGCAGSVFLASGSGQLDGSSAILALVAFHVVLWWIARLLNIFSVFPFSDGVRKVYKIFDTQIGLFLLGVQVAFAIGFPAGSVIHTNSLFSSEYADTVEVITGGRDVQGPTFLKLKNIGQLEFKKTKKLGAPNTRIGLPRPYGDINGPRRLAGARTRRHASMLLAASFDAAGRPGSASGGGGAMAGTVAIPGLSSMAPTPTVHTFLSPRGARALGSRGTPARPPRKTLKAILSEHKRPEPEITQPPPGAKGGAGGKPTTNNAVKGRWQPGGTGFKPKQVDMGGGTGLSGVAAMRARFGDK